MPEEISDQEFDGDVIPLEERAVARDGTIEMRLIQPGWGASGYYPKEVLERDGPNVWPAGTHMYLDHPTETESRERPERSVRDLAAVTISNPVYQEQGKAGPGLYAKATVLPQWKETIDALAPFIGVSIRASGSYEGGEADGREGKIIKTLVKGHSVDFVTKPGAGGKVLAVMESLRQASVPQNEASSVVSTSEAMNSDSYTTSTSHDSVTYTIVDTQETEPQKEAESMTEVVEVNEDASKLETELAEVRKDNDELKIRAERAEGALAILKAQEAVKTMLENVELPVAAKTRIVNKLAMDAPVTEGELDMDALKETVEAEVKVEAEYIEAVTPQGKVTDQGTIAPTAEKTDVKESLTKSLSSFFRLDGEAAKRAVEGR